MQVSKQRSHLFFVKAPLKPRHLALAEQHLPPHLGIRRCNPTGQLRFPQYSVNVWRSGLQTQIVLFMAMRTAPRVKMLALSLLRSQLCPPFASGYRKSRNNKQGQRSQRQQSRSNRLTLA